MYEEEFAMGAKMLIKEFGYKQKAIAEKAGMPPETLSKALNGKRRLFADEAYKISKAFGLSIEEVIRFGKTGKTA